MRRVLGWFCKVNRFKPFSPQLAFTALYLWAGATQMLFIVVTGVIKSIATVHVFLLCWWDYCIYRAVSHIDHPHSRRKATYKMQVVAVCTVEPRPTVLLSCYWENVHCRSLKIYWKLYLARNMTFELTKVWQYGVCILTSGIIAKRME